MQDWSNGYVKQVAYTYGFYHYMTPTHMTFVRQSQYQDGPDLSALKTYCELGCGQGFGTNLLAAANPHMDFYATDFNPAHIAQARKLARRAHQPNVHFFEDSFEAFVDNPDLPDKFDIIALHGIYSWISEDVRDQIKTFLSRKLKPSGMVYISYNCKTGWDPLMPLRDLLRSFVPHDPSPEQVMAAFKKMEALLQSNPGYLRQVPGAKSFFERLKGNDIRYVVHEMFNDESTPFSFSHIERDLSEAKASYIGPLDVLHQYDELHFSQNQCSLLSDSPTQAARQDLRDFLAGSIFRQDLFVKGASRQTVFEFKKGWLNQWLAKATPREDLPNDIKVSKGSLELGHEIYQKIFACFAQGPCQVGDIIANLEEDSETKSYEWAVLIKALTLMVGAKILLPCLPNAGLEARKIRTSRMNRLICEQAITSSNLKFLASPVLGSALSVNRYDMIFMLAEANGEKDPADWAYQQLEWGENNSISAKPGQAPKGPKLERLRELYARFEEKGRDYYDQLGLVPNTLSDQGLAENINGKDEGSEYLPSQEAFSRFSSN